MIYAPTNDLAAVRSAAKKAGTTLPADLEAKARHLDALAASNATPAPSVTDLAGDVAAELGDVKALDRVLLAATDNALREGKRQEIASATAKIAASRLRSEFSRRRDEVAACFAAPLARHLDALNAEAPRLPERFKAEQAADLTPDLFTAWVAARDAYAALTDVTKALRWMYPQGASGLFTPAAGLVLPFTEPPAELPYPLGYRITSALVGTYSGGSELGPLTVQHAFAPALLAHLGCTFRWATPSEVERRLEAIKAGTVQPRAEREEGRRRGVMVW